MKFYEKSCINTCNNRALNWGIIGFFGLDLIGNLFGGTYSAISRVIYSIVGIAGIYLIFTGFSNNDK